MTVEENIDISDITNAHIYNLSCRLVLQYFHRVDDQPLGIFDLRHNKTYVHRRELRLALTSTIDAVLANQRKSIRQNIQSRGEAATDWTHLEFVPFFGLTIMIEQV